MKVFTRTETANLAEADKRHLWHPFTRTDEWMEADPLVIEKGGGPFLYDTEGRRYIDGVASLWCNVHGHNHAYLNKAILEQLSKVSHSTLLGLANEPSIRLAEKLVPFLPEGLNRIFYSDSGAGSVEAALKMAVQYWFLKGSKRTRFVAFEGAYHGDTFGSMSVGYSEMFHKPFEAMLFQVDRITPPYLFKRRERMSEPEAEDASLSQAASLLGARGGETAAVVVEPIVQGAAGIWPHSPSYLKRLFDLAKSFDVLFVADEVAVGFGRTGKMFAGDHAGITPDILCLGKGLSGGYLPLSATIVTAEIFNAFDVFYHGHTFSGNPLGCAAGLASLEIFEKENTLKRLQPRIDLLWGTMKEKFEPHPRVMEVRGFGFFAGIEIGKSKTQAYPAEFCAAKKVAAAARKRGILLRPLSDTLVICPPLNIPEGILEELLNGTLQSIEEVCL